MNLHVSLWVVPGYEFLATQSTGIWIVPIMTLLVSLYMVPGNKTLAPRGARTLLNKWPFFTWDKRLMLSEQERSITSWYDQSLANRLPSWRLLRHRRKPLFFLSNFSIWSVNGSKPEKNHGSYTFTAPVVTASLVNITLNVTKSNFSKNRTLRDCTT